MKVKYEAFAKNGTYKTQDGQEKTRWTKMGVLLDGDKGMSLKIDTMPLNWDGWISLFEPKPKSNFTEAGSSDSRERTARSYANKELDDTPF